jgi:hypothetical protein
MPTNVVKQVNTGELGSTHTCHLAHSARFVAAVIAQLAQPLNCQEKSTFSGEFAELPPLNRSIIVEMPLGNNRISNLPTGERRTIQSKSSITIRLGA